MTVIRTQAELDRILSDFEQDSSGDNRVRQYEIENLNSISLVKFPDGTKIIRLSNGVRNQEEESEINLLDEGGNLLLRLSWIGGGEVSLGSSTNKHIDLQELSLNVLTLAFLSFKLEKLKVKEFVFSFGESLEANPIRNINMRMQDVEIEGMSGDTEKTLLYLVETGPSLLLSKGVLFSKTPERNYQQILRFYHAFLEKKDFYNSGLLYAHSLEMLKVINPLPDRVLLQISGRVTGYRRNIFLPIFWIGVLWAILFGVSILFKNVPLALLALPGGAFVLVQGLVDNSSVTCLTSAEMSSLAFLAIAVNAIAVWLYYELIVTARKFVEK